SGGRTLIATTAAPVWWRDHSISWRCASGASQASRSAAPARRSTPSLSLPRWDRLYAVLDSDAAGQEATTRLVDLLGARVIPVALPPGIKDPADLAQRPDGPELLRGAIRSAVAGRATQGLVQSPGSLRASSANG